MTSLIISGSRDNSQTIVNDNHLKIITHTETNTHTDKHRTQTNIHTDIHTDTHRETHAQTHTHTQTQTHTHAGYMCSEVQVSILNLTILIKQLVSGL